MGSSRIQQGLDPAALDGTRFAPAYNAAVPRNMLIEDAARIKHYVELDKNLRIVVVELFFWNFIYKQPPEPRYTFLDVMRDVVAMDASLAAIADSLATVKSNVVKDKEPQIGRGGNWFEPRPARRYAKAKFESFVENVIRIHANLGAVDLQPSAFAALDRIVEISKQTGVEVQFLMMPHHPYDDYRIRSLGHWPLVEQWYRRLAAYPNVVSASRYTPPLLEDISDEMEYWNDPLHPSVRFGDLILQALAARGNVGGGGRRHARPYKRGERGSTFG
jgi:hypothetical protein